MYTHSVYTHRVLSEADSDSASAITTAAPVNVYFNKLDPHCTHEDLRDFAQSTGSAVIATRVLLLPSTGLSRGQGFAKYASRSDADRAIASLHGTTFLDRVVEVTLAYDPCMGKPPVRGLISRVLVFHLPLNLVRDSIVSVVSEWCHITGCTLHVDTAKARRGKDGQPMFQTACISVVGAEAAQDVVKHLHGARPFDGCEVDLVSRIAGGTTRAPPDLGGASSATPSPPQRPIVATNAHQGQHQPLPRSQHDHTVEELNMSESGSGSEAGCGSSSVSGGSSFYHRSPGLLPMMPEGTSMNSSVGSGAQVPTPTESPTGKTQSNAALGCAVPHRHRGFEHHMNHPLLQQQQQQYQQQQQHCPLQQFDQLGGCGIEQGQLQRHQQQQYFNQQGPQQQQAHHEVAPPFHPTCNHHASVPAHGSHTLGQGTQPSSHHMARVPMNMVNTPMHYAVSSLQSPPSTQQCYQQPPPMTSWSLPDAKNVEERESFASLFSRV